MKHLRHATTFLLVAAFFAFAPALAFAKKKDRSKYNDDKIVSVDVAGNKVTLTEGKNDAGVTYTVNKFTAITIDGNPAKLTDLKKGMYADVQVGTGNVATKIEAQTKKK